MSSLPTSIASPFSKEGGEDGGDEGTLSRRGIIYNFVHLIKKAVSVKKKGSGMGVFCQTVVGYAASTSLQLLASL